MKAKLFACTFLAAFAAYMTAGCSKPSATSGEDTAPAEGTQVLVVGGMTNEIFEAGSGQHITLTEGTVGTPVTDKDGNVRGISIARDNAGGIDVSCACPAGCSEGDGTPGGPGCVVGIPTGGKDASCSGSCSSQTQSCMACSFSFPQPASTDIRAKWVKRKQLAVNPNP
jgi:hypothetical protein